MSKKHQYYICNECGFTSVKWYGRCPECGTWDSLAMQNTGEKQENYHVNKYNIDDIKIKKMDRMFFENNAVNKLFGNGIVKGEIVLLAGAPGVGKSTFSLFLIKNLKNKRILYISGEESELQIKVRVDRLKMHNSFDIIISNDIEEIVPNIDNYDFIIIDSIQTINSSLMQGVSGSPTMVKYVFSKISKKIKSNNQILLIIGHITKDGTIAGPKTLEHMVDGVFFIENLRDRNIKFIKAIKNRFGSTDEMILMSMKESGLEIINNMDQGIMASKSGIGKVLSCTMNGSMPFAIEVQSLITFSKFGIPQRVATGIQFKGVQMLLGVSDKYLKLDIGNMDIFINVSSGININDPMCDLGFIASIYSSAKNMIFGNNTAFIGEITLSGEVIGKNNIEIRVKHLKQIGINKIYIPYNSKINDKEIELVKINNIKELRDI